MQRFLPSGWSNLTWVMAVLVLSFVGFHLHQALIYSVFFQRAVFDAGWVPAILGTAGQWFWTYGAGVVLAWTAWRRGAFNPGIAVVTLLCLGMAHELHYPVLTGFLQLLGQFDPYPVYHFNHLPGYEELRLFN